jgi:hypothetical protein
MGDLAREHRSAYVLVGGGVLRLRVLSFGFFQDV